MDEPFDVEHVKRATELLGNADMHAMCQAFDRCIQAYVARMHPFHSPEGNDAVLALRILRGMAPAIDAIRKAAAKATTPPSPPPAGPAAP